VLEKAIEGLLKNAIENTPEEGCIVIRSYKDNRNCYIEICDFGVGISPENQKMIFGGFFHTQDTMAYSSKRPYEFNAGGTGSDLLRIRALSERFGFTIDFSSKRCQNIPHDADQCPGSISSCSYITDSAECRDADGSTFKLTLPLQKQEQ
jgi:signal transduction histidine kinase